MLIETIFSFVLTVWQGMPEVETWANEHLRGVESLTTELFREEEILCVLEKHRLLSFDGKWAKKQNLEVPLSCKKQNLQTNPIEEIQFRSEAFLKVDRFPSWDHKIDVVVKNQRPFTLFLRKDREYLGAHSTAGWSMWIELKSGVVRYEWVDEVRRAHFRMRAYTDMNPLKGNLRQVNQLDALMVVNNGAKVAKAVVLSGKKANGIKDILLERKDNVLLTARQKCFKTKFCKGSVSMSLAENNLQVFADINSKNYLNFLNTGKPLAFNEVKPEELVPPMAIYR